MGSTVTDALVGRLVDGRYEVLERIARGGMATVYLASDRRLDREVAVKVMHPHLADGASGADFVSRFRREARAAARLTHPGLVAVYDQGVDGETSYLTMEYIDGTNLRHRIQDEGPFTVADALDVVEHVLDALAAAHRHDLVHRDIKPENILLATDGRIKVADFGLARAVTEVTSTTTGTILGTVAYLGPELIATGQCDTRTDVYAVGVMLYEMLTGTQPFTGSTPIQVAFQHVNGSVPEPSDTLPWLPAEIDELTCALAAKSPEDRPADATAALAYVRRVRAELSDDVLGRKGEKPVVAVSPASDDSDGEVPAGDAAAAGGQRTDTDARGEESADISALLDATGVVRVSSPATSARAATTSTSRTDPGSSSENLTQSLSHASSGSTIALSIGSGQISDENAPDEPPVPRRRRRALAWVLVLVLVLGGGGAAGTYWWYTAGPGHYTEVPAGLTAVPSDDAVATLTTAGLGADTSEAYSDTVPAGTVVDVRPAEGEQIPKDGTVELTVSLGIETFVVPAGLTNIPATEAEASLRATGFTQVTSEEQWSTDVPAGTVLSLSAAEGATLPHNESIVLTVSKGPEPVTVPQLVPLSLEEATEQLAAIDISVVTTEEYSDTVPEGKVISQSIEQGTQAYRGDEATLVVSLGMPYVEVPSVITKPVAEARAELEAAGFKVDVSYWLGLFGNEVREQSAAPGSELRKGSTITLKL